MREIKFRAWDRKKLIQGTDIAICLDGLLIDYKNGFDLENPEKYILMQYTGLKDKNGKEIYEGDICKQKGQIVGIIEWNDASFNIGWCFGKSIPDNLEVIGNIYENPELLK